MSPQNRKTVVINGHHYDAITGMPVEPPVAKKASVANKAARAVDGMVKKTVKRTVKPAASTAVHATNQQRSQTLNRRVAQKNTAKKPISGRNMDISRSSKISKFAPNPVIKPTAAPKTSEKPDKPAAKHPLVNRAITRPLRHVHHIKRAAPAVRQAVAKPKTATPAAPVSAKEIKNAAIAKALATETPKAKSVKPAKRGFIARHRRGLTVAVVGLLLLISGAYITITNLPVFSVTMASWQAGIQASYPSHTPDGFSPEYPAKFDDGEVTIKFNSNNGAGDYTIKQENSSWDSTAVLENIVEKAVGDKYSTTHDGGLTIYTYDGNAAWVSGGILYNIINNSTLSTEQVNAIATSL